jgi:hypothetical protein
MIIEQPEDTISGGTTKYVKVKINSIEEGLKIFIKYYKVTMKLVNDRSFNNKNVD